MERNQKKPVVTDFVDITDEDTVFYERPRVSKGKSRIVDNQTIMVDLTDDAAEDFMQTSKFPQSKCSNEKTASIFKSPQTSPIEETSPTTKLTSTFSIKPKENFIDYDICSQIQISQNKHINEAKRLALKIIASLNDESSVNLQETYRTPVFADSVNKGQDSGCVEKNDVILNTKVPFHGGEINKSTKRKRRSTKQNVEKKKSINNGKNTGIRVKILGTHCKIPKQIKVSKNVDFKRNTGLEDMIVRSREGENTETNRIKIIKVRCKENDKIKKIKKDSQCNFQETREELAPILGAEMHDDVCKRKNKTIKGVLKTTKKDSKKQTKRLDDRFRVNYKTKTSKGIKVQNDKRSIKKQLSKTSLQEIKKSLKKFGTKIYSIVVEKVKHDKDTTIKKQEYNYDNQLSVESNEYEINSQSTWGSISIIENKDIDLESKVTKIVQPVETATVISRQVEEKKNFENKVIFNEEILIYNPTSKLNHTKNEQHVEAEKLIIDSLDSTCSISTTNPSKNNISCKSKSFIKNIDSDIVKNYFSKTTPKESGSLNMYAMPTSVDSKICVDRGNIKSHSPNVDKTTKHNNHHNSNQIVDSRRAVSQNDNSLSIIDQNHNSSILIQNQNLSDKNTFPVSSLIDFQSKPVLTYTDRKNEKLARKSRKNQKVNKNDKFDLPRRVPSCIEEQPAMSTGFGLPKNLHYALESATANALCTNPTKMSKKKYITHKTSQSKLLNESDELTKTQTNPQPSSSKQLKGTNPVAQQINSKRSQSDIPLVVIPDDILNYFNIINTMIHRPSNSTLSNQNYELTNTQPVLSKRSKSSAKQQVNLKRRQSLDIPPLYSTDDFGNCLSIIKEMTHRTYNSTLVNGNNELADPQLSLSKHLKSTVSTEETAQQVNSKRRQSRETPPIVIPENIEQVLNFANAMTCNTSNVSLSNQHTNQKPCISKLLKSSTPAAVVTQKMSSKRRLPREIPPVVFPDNVNKNINNSNTMIHGASDSALLNQYDEVFYPQPSSSKQMKITPSNIKRRHSREIPPTVTLNNIVYNTNSINSTKDYLTPNRFDQATVQPKDPKTRKTSECQKDHSIVNMAITDINRLCGSHFESDHHPQNISIPNMLETLQKQNNFLNHMPPLFVMPNFQTNGCMPPKQQTPIQKVHPLEDTLNQYQQSHYVNGPLNIGDSLQILHKSNIPQNTTNYMQNDFIRSVEKSPPKARIETSRPPGLCNVLPENYRASNFPLINCPPARLPTPPPHKPSKPTNSTSNDSSKPGDLKMNFLFKNRSDQEAQTGNKTTLFGYPELDKPEPRANEIINSRNVSTNPSGDKVRSQETLLYVDGDTKHLLSLIDNFIDSE